MRYTIRESPHHFVWNRATSRSPKTRSPLDSSGLNLMSQSSPTLPPDYESIKEIHLIRCISWRHWFGHWDALFDDHVLQTHLDSYLQEAFGRGAQRITLHDIGPFRSAFGSEVKPRMRGTISIAVERRTLRKPDVISGCPSCEHWHPGFQCECECLGATDV